MTAQWGRPGGPCPVHIQNVGGWVAGNPADPEQYPGPILRGGLLQHNQPPRVCSGPRGFQDVEFSGFAFFFLIEFLFTKMAIT